MPNRNSAGKKSRFLLVTLVALIAIGASAVAGYTWYKLKEVEARINTAPSQQAGAAGAPPVAPVYMPLETFTVSLKPGADEDRVLYIGLTLRLANEKSHALLEAYLPEVRSRLLVLFAQQTAEQLSSNEGKIALRQEIERELSKPFAENQSADITDVLFNAFIIR